MTETAPRESPDRDAAASVRPATGPAQAQADPNRTLAGRIRRSFLGSVGSIVFGMEDGTGLGCEGLSYGSHHSARQWHHRCHHLFRLRSHGVD